MSLDGIPGVIDSATNLGNTVNNAVSNASSASSFSGFLDSVTGAFSSLGKFFQTLSGVNLPIKNPLHAYASYDYILSLACLSNNEVTNPDKTYMAGAPLTLICKSANADPTNRINTAYGKFDFFFQDLAFDVATQVDVNLTGNYKLDFTIFEPYSMGMFFESLQSAADQLGYDTWRSAIWLIAIEFRGTKEDGTMVPIPNTKRYIPFEIRDMSMQVDGRGSVYTISGMPSNMMALSDAVAMFNTDISSDGATVGEILQSGEFSLQVALNKFEQEKVDKGLQEKPNQYLIYFPNDPSSDSGSSIGAGGSLLETVIQATIDPSASGSTSDAIKTKFQLQTNTITNDLAQQVSDLNEIGSAPMGFDTTREGDIPMGRDDQVYDNASKTFFGGALTRDPTKANFKFDQKTNIVNAIKQVILQSDYPKASLDASSISPEGYRNMWSIRPWVFPLGTKADSVTGDIPRLYVYKVTPYKVHASRLKAQSQAIPGFNLLSQQAPKQYNYIYTGKNDDILSLNIDVNKSFFQIMPADAGTENSDSKTNERQASGSEGSSTKPLNLGLGSNSVNKQGTGSFVGYIGSLFKSDGHGGGGTERPATRAAKAFVDAMAMEYDVYNIQMEIMGDPYYIAHSGTGNYTSSASQYVNLNADGTMNYENGEVDIVVNFRTPIDINQTTGMYNFGANSQSAPLTRFSGLYCITKVENRMSEGKFTQIISALRRSDQENPGSAIASAVEKAQYLNTNPVVDKGNPSGSEEESSSN